MSLPRVLFLLTLIVLVALLSLGSFDFDEVGQGVGRKLTRSKASLGVEHGVRPYSDCA